MSWLLSSFQPALPEHCVPQNDFLLRFSSAFHTCVPTPLAFASNTLGTLSIIAWLFAQLPQIYKNWKIGSTSGLSIFFLVEWCLGDLGNLLGAIFTHQASWQVAIGSYYVFVDLCLVGQWFWFEKLKHGHPVFKLRRGGDESQSDNGSSGGRMEQVGIEGTPAEDTENVIENESDDVQGQGQRQREARPRIIFRTPTFQADKNEEKASTSFFGTPSSSSITRAGPGSPMPSPSPRTMLFIACLIAIAQASPMSRSEHAERPSEPSATPLENAGTILSWMSTVLYLGSRLPQLFKNWRRKSTAGLSPLLFFAAFCGNLCYSSALLTNPRAWSDFEPYGAGGWVGAEGSNRAEWSLAALPFFLGAFVVLFLDASVGVQFLMYGEKSEKLVVVEEEERGRGRRRHLRRVSGWLRGWVPSISGNSSTDGEREALLSRSGRPAS